MKVHTVANSWGEHVEIEVVILSPRRKCLIVSLFLFQLQFLGAVIVYTEYSVKRRQTLKSYTSI